MNSSPWSGLGKWGVGLGLVALLGVAGCGNATGKVSGTVKIGETLLKGGNVIFISTEGKESKSATIKEDGTYSIDNIPVGNVKVCVETKSLAPPPAGPGGKIPTTYSPPPGADSAGYNPGAGTDRSKLYVAIPDKYSDPNLTDLTYTVTAGSQEYNIPLKK